ncbi:MAG: methionyl-tRNA formyltransferase [Phormidesmis sp. RL_2_1]|nr:methionyl-tRNA formyltransferase [Phormidesmis sp. RL_2_1]
MKIVFFGTPQFAVPSLKRLLSHSDFEVLAVVTQPDKRRGRGGKVMPSPVKAITQACPVWQPARIKKDTATLAQLHALNADAFVVIAYGQLLSQEILDMPRLGCVNAHGSILPEYRGAAPIQWCLYRGEVETGVTTMLMDAGMDTGPMLMEETIPIGLLDNAWQVADKLAELSANLLPTTLQKLHQQMIRPIPQEDERATYAPLITKDDYRLDWRKSAKALHDQVRGFYPNCTAQFRQNDIKISATVPLGLDFWDRLPQDFLALRQRYESVEMGLDHAPGTVIAILKNYGPVVQTGEGHLLLYTVKPAGKKELSGWDFANGSRVEVGEQWES